MKIIIITGPTGSGKTTLAAKIQEKVLDGVILSTDNYYRTGLISKIISKLFNSYFDRKISFNYELFMKDLDFIVSNNETNHKYLYDFDKKTIKKSLCLKKNIKFLIVEGIFAKEVINSSKLQNSLFIELKTDKVSCMNRVIKRDVKQRGKNKKLAKSDFLKSWNLYHKNKKITLGNNITKLDFSKGENFKEIINKLINSDF